MAIEGEYEPSTHPRARAQVELYESSGGTEGTLQRGKPVVILTTVGNKTGKVRKAPLMRVEHDGRYAVVGSLGGAQHDPVWVHNIRANPHVDLQDGPQKKSYDGHETDGTERDEWWARAVEAWPDYANYQTYTERVIPVFVLEPSEP